MCFVGIEMTIHLNGLSLRNLNMSQPFTSPIGQGIRKLALIDQQRTLFGKKLIEDTSLSPNIGVLYIIFN